MKNILKAIIDFFKKLFSKKKENMDEDIVPGITNEDDTIINEDEQEEPVAGENDDENTLECPNVGKNFVILIDNGHGKNTGGKRSPYSLYGIEPAIDFYEYDYNRLIAKKIVGELMKRNYDARLLVTEINDVPLPERAKRVNEICREVGSSNVILISIHSNAAGNGKSWMNAQGWSAYTTKGNTKSDTLAEFLYDEAEKNFKGRKIRKDMSDGDRDWESNFTIIYNTLCPAVLTENFFYDNVNDLMYILSEEGIDAVVKTHVDGIINYINSK